MERIRRQERQQPAEGFRSESVHACGVEQTGSGCGDVVAQLATHVQCVRLHGMPGRQRIIDRKRSRFVAGRVGGPWCMLVHAREMSRCTLEHALRHSVALCARTCERVRSVDRNERIRVEPRREDAPAAIVELRACQTCDIAAYGGVDRVDGPGRRSREIA
jgi:hypothetical protein